MSMPSEEKAPVVLSSNPAGGFTMVELAMVVAIVGVMSTFTVTAFVRNNHEERLKLTSDIVFEYLEKAQRRSQQVLKPCEVVIDHQNLTLAVGNPSDTNTGEAICDGLPMIELASQIKGLSAKEIKICGTSNPSKTSLLCDASQDGSDPNPSGGPPNQTRISFTARGAVSQGGLLKIYSAKAQRSRCLSITSPIGLIREGREKAGACDFT